jgi:hypothetical protein
VADDEGYFFADARMIRNLIRPLDDDSRITTVSLRELSEMGYIEIRKHDTHGEIGYVVSFLNHQVINKPKPSKIKEFFGYGINTVSIPYPSDTEGKGTGNKGTREKERKFIKPTIDELRVFCKEIGHQESDGDAMFYMWESNGWKNGKTPCKNWEMGVRRYAAEGWLASQKLAKQHAPKPISTHATRHPEDYGDQDLIERFLNKKPQA